VSGRDLLELALTLPPSTNHSHKNIRRCTRAGKPYTAQAPTPALLRWRAGAWIDLKNAIAASSWRRPPADAAVIVELRYFWPDLAKRDTHNRIKEIMDAAESAGVFDNDRQAFAQEIPPAVLDRERPRVELRIFPAETLLGLPIVYVDGAP